MSKELIVSSTAHETKVAILDDDQVVEVYFEREQEYSLAGSIHKGRVTRVLPGMQSAFVNIGLERDAFLYVADFFEDTEEYDKVVTEVEEKVARLDRDGSLPPEPLLTAASAGASATGPGLAPVTEMPMREGPPASAEAPPSGSGEPQSDREERDRHHRRNRRRRGRNRGGFPESKYSGGAGDARGDAPRDAPRPRTAPPAESPLVSQVEDVEHEVEHESAAPSEVAETSSVTSGPIILPGESLAKYRERPPVVEAPTSRVDREAQPVAEVIPEPVAPVVVEEPAVVEAAAVEAPAVEAPLPAPPVEEPFAATPVAATPVEEPVAEDVSSDEVAPAEELTAGESQSEEVMAEESATNEGMVASETSEESLPEDSDVDGNVANVQPQPGASASVRGPDQDRRFTQQGRRPRRRGRDRDQRPQGQVQGQAQGQTQGQRRPQQDRPQQDRPQQDRPQQDRPQQGRADARPNRGQPLIGELLKEGQEIIVQIAKEPIGKKGARITSHIALPGRYLVYMPTVDHLGVSRRISSDEERQRLKRVLTEYRRSVNMPGGFIVRTAAEGHSDEDLRADMRFLFNLWKECRAEAERRNAPALLHRDLNLVERILRDQISASFGTIWVDSESEYAKIVEFVQLSQPSLAGRVKLYLKDTPIFEEFGVQEQINNAMKSKVWLKSGGYIVINQTEALVAIDVNTGKYVGKTQRLEDTIVKTNVDAIREIVRQIRLRDLGGIIIIDFIDMDERKNRQRVMQALEEAMRHDRAPSKALAFNDFGLVAITRKRVKQPLEKALGCACPYCSGSGFVKNAQTMSLEILAEARKMVGDLDRNTITLRVNPEIARYLKQPGVTILQEIEEMARRPVMIKSDSSLHQENFDIH